MSSGPARYALSPPVGVIGTAFPPWVVVFCAMLWMTVGLFGHEPYKPDEAYTVGLVKSIVDGDGWVVPKLVGEPFMEKPPLFFVVASVFSKTFSWIPLHEASRFAVLFFVAIGLLATAACARECHGRGSGRLAVLLTLATFGTVVRLHQLITDTGLFAGIAVGLWGLALAPRRPLAGGAAIGVGIAIAFLCKGLLGPGLIVCSGLVLMTLRPWRQFAIAKTIAVAALVSIPSIACWLIPLQLQAPDQFQVWFFANNVGRFIGSNNLGPKKDLLFYLHTLVWYALPCWPLAAWGWMRLGRNGAAADERYRAAPVLVFLIVGITVLTLASDGRELYALVLVPAFAVAATGGLLSISTLIERRLAWAMAAFFLILTSALLAIWVLALKSPTLPNSWPVIVRLPTMVAPAPIAMVVFAVVALALLVLMTLLRRPARGTLPLAGAAGMALLWASLVLPWSAYLDVLKGYKAVALELAQQLPASGCVASSGLGEGERALFDYFIGLRTRRVETTPSASECPTLLVQSLTSDKSAKADSTWQLSWTGARVGVDESVLRLYSKATAASELSGP
jgi:4-amino-4-deoxy-L-arabinose transferase-like glycosyltransferase